MGVVHKTASTDPNLVFVSTTKIFIGGKADNTNTSASLTWTEIGFTLATPEFGASAAEVTAECLSSGKKYFAKGVFDMGGGEISFIRDYKDTGQSDLKAAAESTHGTPYHFLMVRPNAATAGGTGTQIYAQAHFMQFKESAANGPNNFAQGVTTIKYATTPVIAAAT